MVPDAVRRCPEPSRHHYKHMNGQNISNFNAPGQSEVFRKVLVGAEFIPRFRPGSPREQAAVTMSLMSSPALAPRSSVECR